MTTNTLNTLALFSPTERKEGYSIMQITRYTEQHSFRVSLRRQQIILGCVPSDLPLPFKCCR